RRSAARGGELSRRLERSLVDRQRARIGVDGGSDAERQRAEVLAVPERQIEDDRDPERRELLLEDVLERAAAQPRILFLRRVGLRELADRDPGDRVELPGVSELRQDPVDVPGRAVDVLEEEDAAVELDLPRRCERLAQEP